MAAAARKSRPDEFSVFQEPAPSVDLRIDPAFFCLICFYFCLFVCLFVVVIIVVIVVVVGGRGQKVGGEKKND